MRLLYGLPFVLLTAGLIAMHRAGREGMFMDGLFYAALGRGAADGGHWIVPHLSPQMFQTFFDHPPTYFIYEGGLFSVFGASWVTARLSILPFVLGCFALVWVLVKPAAGRRAAFGAGLMLLACIPFMKWARFPNLDIPLALFGGLALWQAHRALDGGRPRSWLLAGLFFGLALLMKGWFALFVPLAILLYAAWSRTLRELASPWPWLGLLGGLALFALWPLALWTQGRLDGFTQYLEYGLGHSGGEGASRGFRLLETLLTRAPLPLLFALLGVRALIRRGDRRHVGWMLVAWCLAIYLPLQLARAEHRHWLLALYPALAGLAGIGAAAVLPRRVIRGGARIAWIVTPILLIVLAVLPVAQTGHRDRVIYETITLADSLSTPPTAVVCVDACVPTWRFLSAHAFIGTVPGELAESAELGPRTGSQLVLICPPGIAARIDPTYRRYKTYTKPPVEVWLHPALMPAALDGDGEE